MSNSIIYTGNKKDCLGSKYKNISSSKDTFGMYRDPLKYSNRKNAFISELCKTAQKPLKNSNLRVEKSQYLKQKYKNFAYSEKSIIKVFEAYFYCINNWELKYRKQIKRSSFIKNNLPIYLKNNHVDSRIINRIIK